MMTFLINSYLNILLSIAISSGIVFLIGVYYIIKRTYTKTKQDTDEANLVAIAGEDLIATQLDLACAYIQVNKISLAKKILESILTQGNAEQQQEARRLLDTI